MKIGDTFLMEKPRGIKHLFIVVAKNKSKGHVLLVHVTSSNNRVLYDASCILDVGDHEFIKHKSYVRYSETFWAIEDYIENQIFFGICKQKPPLRPEVLKKVLEGVAKSSALPPSYKPYFSHN